MPESRALGFVFLNLMVQSMTLQTVFGKTFDAQIYTDFSKNSLDGPAEPNSGNEISRNTASTNESADVSTVKLTPEDSEGNTRTIFSLSNSKDDVRFFLYYDPKHSRRFDELFLNNKTSIRKAKFKIGKPLIFITHGFMSGHDFENSTVPLIRNAYLKRGFSNVIGVDWNKLSTPDNIAVVAVLSYVSVMQNVRPVGERVAEFIEFLIQLKIVSGPNKIHLIGHSLGAHVMGVAGDEIQNSNKSQGSIDRISGLDPAGPLFNLVKEKDRLDPLDASFVDVIHTDAGMFGSSEILGTVDFFANGGKGYAQPGCLNFTLDNLGMFARGIVGICSHARAYQLFARSILRTSPELYGCRCRLQYPNLIVPTKCIERETRFCLDRTLFGQYVPRSARGNLFLDTSPATPDLRRRIGNSRRRVLRSQLDH